MEEAEGRITGSYTGLAIFRRREWQRPKFQYYPKIICPQLGVFFGNSNFWGWGMASLLPCDTGLQDSSLKTGRIRIASGPAKRTSRKPRKHQPNVANPPRETRSALHGGLDAGGQALLIRLPSTQRGSHILSPNPLVSAKQIKLAST